MSIFKGFCCGCCVVYFDGNIYKRNPLCCWLIVFSMTQCEESMLQPALIRGCCLSLSNCILLAADVRACVCVLVLVQYECDAHLLIDVRVCVGVCVFPVYC